MQQEAFLPGPVSPLQGDHIVSCSPASAISLLTWEWSLVEDEAGLNEAWLLKQQLSRS